MRIIVWGINYAPEFTGIAPHNVALCEFLHENGDDVEMITTFAYYPTWRKQPEDRGQLYRVDNIRGVRVNRCWHFVPARVNAWKRILHEGTFILTSTVFALRRPRADVYVVPSPPLALGVAAWLVSRIKRAPFIFHVQDLQPDAAVGLGMIKAGWFTRLLYALESFAYDKAKKVSGISHEILDAFRRKGVPESKLIYFPNTVVIPKTVDLPNPGLFRAKYNIAPDDFLAVYAGNLGMKQGLGILIDAAKLVKNPRVRIVICGDGAARESLELRVREERLPNVSLLPLQDSSEYPALLIDADVNLITQLPGSGNAFFPSKLLHMLSYARPVVTVADEGSALAKAVQDGAFGMNVPPGASADLARVLDQLAADESKLTQFGVNGRQFVQQFERTEVMKDFYQQLQAVGAVTAD